MKVKSVSKRVGVSAIKARIVADTVRGMNAQDAVGVLTYVSKGSALHVKKAIQSALANAKNNYNLNAENMIVQEIRVDKGPIANFNVKRGIMLGKGGFARFDRKYCHITVVLEDKNSVTEVVTKKESKAKKLETVEAEVAEDNTAKEKKTEKNSAKKAVSSKKTAK